MPVCGERRRNLTATGLGEPKVKNGSQGTQSPLRIRSDVLVQVAVDEEDVELQTMQAT